MSGTRFTIEPGAVWFGEEGPEVQARTLCLCRGNSKVFTLAEISDVPTGSYMEVTAVGNPGTNSIPAAIFPYEAHPGQYVTVNFDMPFQGVELRISAVDETGVQLGSCTLSYEPAKAVWLSRANYRLQGKLCASIRDYDHGRMGDRLTFKLLNVIHDASRDEDIMRVCVHSPLGDDEVSLRILALDFSKYGADPIPMGATRRTSKRQFGATDLDATFSVRVPRPGADMLYVLESKKHPELMSFGSIEHGKYMDQLYATDKLMCDAGLDPYYSEWFSEHRATKPVLDYQRAQTLSCEPTFSLVVPLFKTPLAFFEDMVASVKAQSYAKWELVLVNASPEDQVLGEQAALASKSDNRIKLVTLERNLGISENTNAGIAEATGDFIGFLDHDDTIEPDLLYEYALAINEHPDTDVLYCDEDKLMPDGSYALPYFKADFGIDLLRFNNFVCHLLMLRLSLYERLTPNTSEFDGAQDHNLVLQASEHARRIHHVSRVLYHWRISETSTAGNTEGKPEANAAGLRAVREHLERLGIRAKVTGGDYAFSYKVVYEPPVDLPLVSIVIPSKDHVEVLKTCVESVLAKTTYPHFEIVVVDNGSTEQETMSYYDELSSRLGERFALVKKDMEFNFSRMINMGVSAAKGDYLLLLNNDTELIAPDWLEQLVGVCSRNEVGAAGVRLYYRDDTIQHAGGFFVESIAGHFGRDLPRGAWGYWNLANCPQDLSLVTAACMMTSRAKFDEVGGFEERLAVEWNDVDYCLKLRDKGYLVYYTPWVELYHYESLSRGTNDTVEEMTRAHEEKAFLNARWARNYVEGDPYLNRNLSIWADNAKFHAF